jgi:hypothetical protein
MRGSLLLDSNLKLKDLLCAGIRPKHSRSFNGQHAQIPTRVNGQRIREYEEFLTFAQEVMHLWKKAPGNAERTMWVCPEIGPVVSGYSLSHEAAPWEQAVFLAKDLRAIWG